MTRVGIVMAVLAVAVAVYAIADLGFTRRRARGLPKPVWVLVILLLPLVGAALWFLIGRPRDARTNAPRGPDDDPSFLHGTGVPPSAPTVDEETLRRLEEDFRGLDADSEDDGEGRRR